MAKVLIFITGSLDGFIARKNGDVDWLLGTDGEEEYQNFYNRIGITLMGFNTYQEILNFGVDYPYPEKKNFVFSRKNRTADGHPVTFIKSDPAEFVQAQKEKTDEDIWLVGGGQLNTLLLNAGLVDELIYYLQPILLGEGIPLFALGALEQKWALYQQETYTTGVVKLHYLKGI